MSLTFEPIPVPLHLDETGTIRVSGTRVTLDTIIHSYNAGESPEELAQDFPRVPPADIYAVIAYYHAHEADVDTYLRQRETEASRWREFWESRYDKQAIRERLLARKAKIEAEQHASTDRG